jgi:hypothetical protein
VEGEGVAPIGGSTKRQNSVERLQQPLEVPNGDRSSQMIRVGENKEHELSTLRIQIVILSILASVATRSLCTVCRTTGREELAYKEMLNTAQDAGNQEKHLPSRIKASSSQDSRSLWLLLDCESSSPASIDNTSADAVLPVRWAIAELLYN